MVFYIRNVIAQEWGAHNRKARLLFGGGDSKGTRLNDSSDCSTEAERSIYAKWRIFVCQVATFVGVGPRPYRVWTSENSPSTHSGE